MAGIAAFVFAPASLNRGRVRRRVSAEAQSSSRPVVMGISFRKYHGLGNDFILVDNRKSTEPMIDADGAIRICDRRRGVGADGLIFLLPPLSPNSDAQMRLYNSDGSEPEMCGNGIRCLARFAADLGMNTAFPERIVVDTMAGTMIPEVVPNSEDVKVDMGPPILVPADVPTTLDTAVDNHYTGVMKGIAGKDWEVTAVSMGNPHCVTFVDKSTYFDVDANLEEVGPAFETDVAFPAKTNTEFVLIHSRTEMSMVVWERGAGRTMACGTGACAVAVAAIVTGRADQDTAVTVHLPGGDLTIEWSSASNHVFMTGPAEFVFSGELQQR
jgi:diaminopimelate epimerase